MTTTATPKAETPEQKLARLEAENASLLAAANTGSSAGKLTLKISLPRAAGTNGKDDKGSDGGGVSVYGLGRFPVTLYKEQWVRLLEEKETILAFLNDPANAKLIRTKAD